MYNHIDGYEGNNMLCTCGRHSGIGELSPERYAAMAKRMQEKTPDYMSENMKRYLADWERYHGPVRYRMEVVGKNLGSLDKSEKGIDITGPVFVKGDTANA